MTICISSLSGKDYAIVSSDRMVTLSLPSTEFEQNVPKTVKITENCVASTAGNALGFVPIHDEVMKMIQQNKSKSIHEISQLVLNAYKNARNAKLDQVILSTMGLTMQTFYQLNRSLAPEIIANLTQAMQQYQYGLSILIAGVDESGSHIYRIDNPGRIESYDSIGHCSIGSGELHAISTFIANDYDPKFDLDHVVAMTYEAKRRSEKAQGVGEETDLYIICKKGITKLPDNKIDELSELYDKKNTQEQESVSKLEEFIKKLDIKSLDGQSSSKL